ncbi:MlaD family protein [Candidatus Margulisiibacteriota bacterium]
MKLSMYAKVGLVVTLAVLILGGMIVWKGDVFLKARGYRLVGSFNDVGGLLVGAEVRYRGYKAGKVVKVHPNPEDIKVYLRMDPGIKVPVGSQLRVAFDGLIGQKYVEVIPSREKEILRSGSVIKGYNTLGLVDFIHIGTKNLEESKQILESVREITDDPKVQRAAKDILINIENSTDELDKIVSGFSRALEKGGFEELITSLSSASENIGTVSKRFDKVIMGLEKLSNDPTFMGDIKDTVKNAKDAFAELKKASQTANKVLQKYSR